MGRVCILTDESAQFSRPDFPGRDLVQALPGGPQTESPRPPAEAARDFLNQFRLLEHACGDLLVITAAGALGPAADGAAQAKAQYGGRLTVQVIDSQTTSAGLGWLVELAAGAAARGAGAGEIEHLVRAAMPRVYTLFCLPGLSHLAAGGLLSEAQAVAGEVLGLLPIFAFEDGRLTPLSKVRTQRHLAEAFQEFLEEFERPAHIALAKVSSNHFRARLLREFAAQSFPGAPFSEHPLPPPLAALFGPQAIGLIVMEGIL